jgi:hypothetical protein
MLNEKDQKKIDYKSRCQDLEQELSLKDDEIIEIKNKFKDSQNKLHDTIMEKRSLEKRVKEFELRNYTIQFSNLEELKDENNKLKHRTEITKKQLDDAKSRIELMKQVIKDLEDRGLSDFILKRSPISLVEYGKKY